MHKILREIVIEASPTVTLTTILGSEEGIQALTLFLIKSGAFTRTATTGKHQTYQAPTLNDEPEVEYDSETPYDPDGG